MLHGVIAVGKRSLKGDHCMNNEINDLENSRNVYVLFTLISIKYLVPYRIRIGIGTLSDRRPVLIILE